MGRLVDDTGGDRVGEDVDAVLGDALVAEDRLNARLTLEEGATGGPNRVQFGTDDRGEVFEEVADLAPPVVEYEVVVVREALERVEFYAPILPVPGRHAAKAYSKMRLTSLVGTRRSMQRQVINHVVSGWRFVGLDIAGEMSTVACGRCMEYFFQTGAQPRGVWARDSGAPPHDGRCATVASRASRLRREHSHHFRRLCSRWSSCALLRICSLSSSLLFVSSGCEGAPGGTTQVWVASSKTATVSNTPVSAPNPDEVRRCSRPLMVV